MSNMEQFQNPPIEHVPGPNANLPGKSPAEPTPSIETGTGLAVASFVLGLVSLPLSIFVVGAVAGFIGLILAIVHLSKKLPLRGLAICALVLSAIGLVAGTGFAVFYSRGIYRSYSVMMQDWQDVQFEEYIGAVSPDMKLTDLQGNEITISELKGKRVVLDFWATWCPPCRKEIPHFIELTRTTGDEELVIIGISDESAEKIKTFAENLKINYPLVSAAARELPEPYSKITSIPTTFFIDRQGVIQNVLVGYHSFKELKKQALGEMEKTDEPKPDMTGSR